MNDVKAQAEFIADWKLEHIPELDLDAPAAKNGKVEVLSEPCESCSA